MMSAIVTARGRFAPGRPCSGTVAVLAVMLAVHACGLQASLSLGPEGHLPSFRDVLLYAVSHDDAASLLVNLCCLLLVGPCQERRWGTAAFLVLSALSWAALPCAYNLVLWAGAAEASRVCGYSAVQLALFTAQCTQELERCSLVHYVPAWAYVSSRPWLPTHTASHRFRSHSEALHREEPRPSPSSFRLCSGTAPGLDHFQSGAGPGRGVGEFQSGTGPGRGAGQFQSGAGPGRGAGQFQSGAGLVWDGLHHGATEAELLEEQMLGAGILASLQDAVSPPGATGELLGSCQGPDVTSGALSSLEDILDPLKAKVELPKSSVSSLRPHEETTPTKTARGNDTHQERTRKRHPPRPHEETTSTKAARGNDTHQDRTRKRHPPRPHEETTPTKTARGNDTHQDQTRKRHPPRPHEETTPTKTPRGNDTHQDRTRKRHPPRPHEH